MSLTLKGRELHRVKLREWIELESIKEQAKEAVESGSDGIVDCVLSYVSTASGFDYKDEFWLETVEAMTLLQKLNAPKEFPIFRVHKKPNSVTEFHYEGREWYFWVNLFAKAYGWTIEYISDLDIDYAIALLQEIVYDDLNEKEYMWILSEVSYEYDKRGKGKLRKFNRPEWLRSAAQIKEPKKVRIRKDLLPVGNVISAEEIQRAYKKEEGISDQEIESE